MEAPHESPPLASTDASEQPSSEAELAEKNKKMLKIAGAILLASFAFGWGSIPLYQLVCKPLFDPGGSSADNGTAEAYPGPKTAVDKSRNIKVRFVAEVNKGLPWEFRPKDPIVMLHPGEKKVTNFFAKNLDHARTITGKAVYDIVPYEAAAHLHKVQCFCFTKETFGPGESRDMPILFWFDTDLPDDIKEITVAYTFFKYTGDETGQTKTEHEKKANEAKKAWGIDQ